MIYSDIIWWRLIEYEFQRVFEPGLQGFQWIVDACWCLWPFSLQAEPAPAIAAAEKPATAEKTAPTEKTATAAPAVAKNAEKAAEKLSK